MVQGKIAHTGDLNPVGQQARLVLISQAYQVVHLLRGVEVLLVLPEPVFGDVLQHRRGLAVHHAAVGDAALGVDVINDGLGHGRFRTEQGAGLEFSSIGHNEIAGGEIGHILVHIKATGKVHRHSKQHHRQ